MGDIEQDLLTPPPDVESVEELHRWCQDLYDWILIKGQDGMKMKAYTGTNWRNVRSDSSTRSLQVIDYAHHEIHGGSSYEHSENYDISANNVRDIQITTPNTTKWAHFFFSIETESETDCYFYEDITITTPGTAVTPVNHNRNSDNTSGLTMKYIDNTTIGNANADTSASAATTLTHFVAGGGKDSGGHDHAHEFILKQNEDYMIRFIGSSAGNISYHLYWYEHTDKDA